MKRLFEFNDFNELFGNQPLNWSIEKYKTEISNKIKQLYKDDRGKLNDILYYFYDRNNYHLPTKEDVLIIIENIYNVDELRKIFFYVDGVYTRDDSIRF
jgi:hypothetical protein